MRSFKKISNIKNFYFIIFSIFMFGFTAKTLGQEQCLSLFISNLTLLQMQSQYIGEDQGLYFDKITRKHWKVKYFSPAEKRKYQLIINNKRLTDLNKNKYSSEFDFKTGLFTDGLVILDLEQNIYLLPFEERGLYHHSSLSNGQNVFFAGTMTVSDGLVISISDLSGHYKPNISALQQFIHYLESSGLDLRYANISGYNVLKKFKQHSMTYKEWKKLNP